MCVSLNNLLLLDSGEAKSLLTLHRLIFKDELKKAACFLITSAYRYRFMYKFFGEDQRALELQLGKFRYYLSEFERCKKKQRSLYNFDSFNEIVEYQLDEILELEANEKKDEEIEFLVQRLSEKFLGL